MIILILIISLLFIGVLSFVVINNKKTINDVIDDLNFEELFNKTNVNETQLIEKLPLIVNDLNFNKEVSFSFWLSLNSVSEDQILFSSDNFSVKLIKNKLNFIFDKTIYEYKRPFLQIFKAENYHWNFLTFCFRKSYVNFYLNKIKIIKINYPEDKTINDFIQNNYNLKIGEILDGKIKDFRINNINLNIDDISILFNNLK